MAIELRRESASGVTNPPESHISFFTDENGNPSLKDSNGVVTPATSAGSPVTFNLQVSAPPPAANTVKIYSKDVSGQTEMFVIDALGNEIQVTSGGNLVGGVPSIDWKSGTPGNPYVAGDTVSAEFGTIIMVMVETPGVVTFNLPTISAANAGRTIHVRNLVDKKGTGPGTYRLVPDPADSIEALAAGTSGDIANEFATHIGFESDGVGRWNMTILGFGGVPQASP